MLPLDGVRVIEFCNVAAGPFCGMLLADLGADVIKVEHPDGGDTMRAWPPITEGYSENFASLNRNKRSVTLDLKQPEDRQQARGLVLDADVLIENNRPGVMTSAWARLRSLAARQAFAGVLLDLRLWPGGAAIRRGRIRSDDAGNERHHERHR